MSLGQADVQPFALHFLASRPYARRVPHFPLPSLELAHDWQWASWAAHRAGISAAGPRLSGAGQGPPAVGVKAKGLLHLPPPGCASSPFPLLFPICHPSLATLFLFWGWGWCLDAFVPLLFIRSHFPQPKPSSVPSMPGKRPQGNCGWLQRGTAHTTGFASGPWLRVFGPVSVCFARPESWDCLAISRAPGTFQIFTGLVCLQEAGGWKGDEQTCSRALKEAHSSVGKSNF